MVLCRSTAESKPGEANVRIKVVEVLSDHRLLRGNRNARVWCEWLRGHVGLTKGRDREDRDESRSSDFRKLKRGHVGILPACLRVGAEIDRDHPFAGTIRGSAASFRRNPHGLSCGVVGRQLLRHLGT